MTAMTRLILASLIIAALLVGTAGVEAIPVAHWRPSPPG